MSEIYQLSFKCPKCDAHIVVGLDLDTQKSMTCAGCGYNFTEEEILKQAEPQLAAIAEKKTLEAFKKVPGFKPNK